MQTAVMMFGLVLAGVGHALLHDWRGALDRWDAFDGRFPVALRTPASIAGPLLLASGAACSLAPALG